MQMQSKNTSYVNKLTNDECQKALEKWAGKICCGTSKPAVEGHIVSLISYNALDVSNQQLKHLI